MKHQGICFANQAERPYIPTAANTKHFMLDLKFEYFRLHFFMQSFFFLYSPTVSGHRCRKCKNYAKTAEHEVTIYPSQFSISLTRLHFFFR